MKFVLLAALAAVSQAVKLTTNPGTYEGLPSQTGNYSPRADEYSDYHPHVQTYTWDSTGGHIGLNRVRAGYADMSQYTINDNGQGKGDGQTHW